MSVVTNYIVVCGVYDGGGKALEEAYGFSQIDEYAGGDKALEVDVWAVALNYSDLAAGDIFALPWDDPEGVMLLVQEQEALRPAVWVMDGIVVRKL